MVLPDLPGTFSGPHPLSSIHGPPCKLKAPEFCGSDSRLYFFLLSGLKTKFGLPDMRDPNNYKTDGNNTEIYDKDVALSDSSDGEFFRTDAEDNVDDLSNFSGLMSSL